MSYLESGGRLVELDEDGFLVNMDDWDEGVAKALAGREGGPDLTGDIMEILLFMRTYYRKFHAFPILNYVCKNLHQPRNCIREKFLDPMLAWKLAGLPKLGVVATESTDQQHKVFTWLVPD